MKRRPLLPTLLLALAFAPMAQARSDHYALDPVHTRVLFAVAHDGYSQALGTVSGSVGALQFDPDDWSTARIEAVVPIDKLDLGDAKWNDATRGLLDADKFPTARFVSTRVEFTETDPPGTMRVFGDLTLHGVTREVLLYVRFNQLKRFGLPPFHRIVGFSATTSISRSDFGITSWKSMIGDEVQLRLEIEAIRSHRDDDSDAAAPEPPSTPQPTATP